MTVGSVVSILLISGGVFFYFAGTVGLLRLPDIFSRLHALTKVDNLGLGLIVVGLLPLMTSLFAALQLIIIWLLVMWASAASCNLIARFANDNHQTKVREDASNDC